jgi:very-short-patch-repair endonuclease
MSSVAHVVAEFGGVASVTDLGTRGSTLREVDLAVRSGLLRRVRRGWVALPGADAELETAVRAGGVLSCVSVLKRAGIWTGTTDSPHVRVHRYAKIPPAVRQLATVHRALPLAGLPEPRGALDSLGWALSQATMCQSRRDAVSSLDSAVHLGLLSPIELEPLLTQLPHAYAKYLGLVDGRAESGLETHVRLLLRSVGIRTRVQVRIDGVGRVDLLVGDRLVIETDGRLWHSDERSFADDKRRDLALAERGYLVLRLSYAQVIHESDHVLSVVRALVARDEHLWSGRHRRRGLVAS